MPTEGNVAGTGILQEWLGAREDLNKILSLLEKADETLPAPIASVLTDLTGRKLPPALAGDAPEFGEVLRASGEGRSAPSC